MPRKLLAFVIFILLFVFSGQAQIQHDCFTSSGVSSSGSVAGITVHQSVGQGSVIGNFVSEKLTLRQGFLQPSIILNRNSEKDDIDIQVFPNPFSETVHVHFSKSLNEVIQLTVFSASGAILKSFKSTMDEMIQFDLSGLAQGLYILQVETEQSLYATKIQKL